jgi:hypothetical protein
MKFIAVDPGDEFSGFVTMDLFGNIYNFGKIKNEELLKYFNKISQTFDVVVFEMVAGYSSSKHVTETILWIGKFIRELELLGKETDRIFRASVLAMYPVRKKARETEGITFKTSDVIIEHILKENYKEKLVETFGKERVIKYFVKDVWQALALGIAFIAKKDGTYDDKKYSSKKLPGTRRNKR